MVSEGAPAAELLGPCGHLKGWSGSAQATWVGRGGRRLFQELPSGTRTLPWGPGGGGSWRDWRQRLQHRPVLDDGAPGSGASPGASRLSDALDSERRQSLKPHFQTQAVARQCGLVAGHKVALVRAVLGSSGTAEASTLRLYLRSRLTSAAQPREAKPHPGTRPATHLLTAPRTHTPGPPHQGRTLGSSGQLVVGWGQGVEAFTSSGFWTPPPRWPPDTEGWEPRSKLRQYSDPDRDRAQTQALHTDKRSHHADTRKHKHRYKGTLPGHTTTPTWGGEGEI